MLRTKQKTQSQKAAKSKNQTSGKRLGKYPKIGSKVPIQNPVTAIGAGIKTKCCEKQGVLLLKEIREYQALTKLLLSKKAAYRVIQEVTEDVRTTKKLTYSFRYTHGSLEAMYEALVVCQVRLFEDANLCSLHMHHIMVQKKDIQLACRIRKKDV